MWRYIFGNATDTTWLIDEQTTNSMHYMAHVRVDAGSAVCWGSADVLVPESRPQFGSLSVSYNGDMERDPVRVLRQDFLRWVGKRGLWGAEWLRQAGC